MENFKDFKVIRESKDSIINRMNLTDEQKRVARDFFNKHNDFEKEVDWNKWRTLTWEDLSAVIYKDRSTKSQLSKKVKGGIEGLVEGTDYEVLAEGDFEDEHWVAYHPMTWVGSRAIASNSVPPVNEDGNGSAEWCTAYQKDDSFWNKHAKFEEFIYLCGESIPTKKVAISVNMCGYRNDMDGFGYYESCDDIYYNIWNYWDENDDVNLDELPSETEDMVKGLYDRYHWNHHRTKAGDVMGEYGEDAYNGYIYMANDTSFKYFDESFVGYYERGWMCDSDVQELVNKVLSHKEITLDFSEFHQYCNKDALIEHFGSFKDAVRECQPKHGTDVSALAYGYLEKHGGEDWMKDCIDPYDFIEYCIYKGILYYNTNYTYLFMKIDSEGNIEPVSL